MWYKIDIEKDSFKVRSYTSEDIVRVTLYVSDNCEGTYEKVIDTYEVDFEETKKFPLIDGIYKIHIERVYNNTIVDQDELLYPYYNMLLTSIISDIERILCNCSCSDCGDDCLNNELDNAKLLLKVFSYHTLLYKYYPRFYDSVFSCLHCDIADINNCNMVSEKLSGNSELKDMLKKILSAFYLSFYFAEYYTVTDKESVNIKFKYDKLKNCIKATDVNINCIKEKIENGMATVTMLNTAYVNQPPTTVGNISIEQPNRVNTTYTLAHFTTATTPAYSDPENDPLNAIRVDTLPTYGQLTFENNPVTVGQVILATDITAGKFKYIAPDQGTLNNTSWNYSARDAGSMTFKS